MSVFKSHRYGVRTEWHDGRQVTLTAPGKPPLDVALPPDFKNGVAGVWSPEELVIASLATCFELTLLAVAEYRSVPVRSARVDATGHVERKDHLYRLKLLELDVRVETEAGRERELERIAEIAQEGCLIGNALDVPIRLELSTQTAEATMAAAS